jgi:hypothetical protein
MARSYRHLTLLVTLLGSGACAATAPRRELAFTVFSTEPLTALAYVAKAGTRPTPLVLYPTARSPRYRQSGSGPVKFVNSATGTGLAEAEVPDGIHQALILFVGTKLGGSVPGKVWVLDDDKLGQAAGEVWVLNLSGLKLEGRINRQFRRVPEQAVMCFPAGVGAAIELWTEFKGRKYQAYAETLTSGPAGGALLLLLPPYHPGAQQVQSRILLPAPPGGATEAGR